MKYEVEVEVKSRYKVEVHAISPQHARDAAWSVFRNMPIKSRDAIECGVGSKHNEGSWLVSVVEPTLDERIKASAQTLEIILDEDDGQKFNYVNLQEEDLYYACLFGKTIYFNSADELASAIEAWSLLAHHMLKRCVKAADSEEC